jgi:putative Ca2+/H+ antiporter (TMEM165/GDT1 family)
MDWKTFLTVFGAVFLAELGDKTQLATLLFATKEPSAPLTIFLGAAIALVITSAIGVAVGTTLSSYVNPKYLSYAAGVAFIAIGVWTLYQAAATTTPR